MRRVCISPPFLLNLSMEKRIKDFLTSAESGLNGPVLDELKALHKEITGKEQKCLSDTCKAKMLEEIRKYNYLQFEAKPGKAAKARKYTLKEGNHAFAPGTPAIHNNDNTSDRAIEVYLKAYPHIKKLLIN